MKRLLLDTHIALWALLEPQNLTALERRIIADRDNDVSVSIASLWEITIKYSLGKSRNNPMPFSAKEAQFYFAKAGFEFLPITSNHILMLEELPPLHADPFDRLIVAQAKAEQFHLITHDAKVLAYFAQS